MTVMSEKEAIEKKVAVQQVCTLMFPSFKVVFTPRSMLFMGDGQTITIDENTTLSSLISQINNSDEAQATAYWDDTTGKLTITSKKEGASYINIEAGTSNFTDVMGLTTTERDVDGNVVSTKMFTEVQELGKNSNKCFCFYLPFRS